MSKRRSRAWFLMMATVRVRAPGGGGVAGSSYGMGELDWEGVLDILG